MNNTLNSKNSRQINSTIWPQNYVTTYWTDTFIQSIDIQTLLSLVEFILQCNSFSFSIKLNAKRNKRKKKLCKRLPLLLRESIMMPVEIYTCYTVVHRTTFVAPYWMAYSEYVFNAWFVYFFFLLYLKW